MNKPPRYPQIVDRVCGMCAASIRLFGQRAVVWNESTGQPAVIILRFHADEALALSSWIDIRKVEDRVLVADHAVLSTLMTQPVLALHAILGGSNDSTARFAEQDTTAESVQNDSPRKDLLRLPESANEEIKIPGYGWRSRAKDSSTSQCQVVAFPGRRSSGGKGPEVK